MQRKSPMIPANDDGPGSFRARVEIYITLAAAVLLVCSAYLLAG